MTSRELDFDNYNKLDEIDAKVDHVVQAVTDEACKLARTLEELSSSSNSILAQSQSTDRKLGDVSSEVSSLWDELRDGLRALADLVSSGSSQSSRKDYRTMRHGLATRGKSIIVPRPPGLQNAEVE